VSASTWALIALVVNRSRSGTQGISLSLEGYLNSEDTLVDRLHKGPYGTSERLSQLRGEIDKLVRTVTNATADSAGGHRA
jgi:hypothetical protein